jgi:alpha-1,3-rhamnosyl/mannosyltransferase
VLDIPLDKIDVVTEAADPAFRVLKDPARVAAARAKHTIPEGAPLFVYVGGLNPHKNLLRLLHAWPEVIERRPNAHLAIVGDTSGKGFYDNVAELQHWVGERPEVRKLVRFTGYLSDEDLVSLFNGAEALVLPSLWEGFGLPAVEAMACGLPVIASARASLPEVIGDAGLFFDPESSPDIARSINALLDNPELRARLRANTVRRAGSFTWDRGAQLAEDCFRRTVKR